MLERRAGFVDAELDARGHGAQRERWSSDVFRSGSLRRRVRELPDDANHALGSGDFHKADAGGFHVHPTHERRKSCLGAEIFIKLNQILMEKIILSSFTNI
jgi:hypothetical protein